MLQVVSNNQIQTIIQRIERLEDEKSAIGIDISEIYKEAKGNGFEVKILKKIIALRKKPQHERDQEQALLDTYLAAIEGFENTPLGKFASEAE